MGYSGQPYVKVLRAVCHTIYGYSHILYGCHTVYSYCMTVLYTVFYKCQWYSTVGLTAVIWVIWVIQILVRDFNIVNTAMCRCSVPKKVLYGCASQVKMLLDQHQCTNSIRFQTSTTQGYCIPSPRENMLNSNCGTYS
jgi:hypothetical protein